MESKERKNLRVTPEAWKKLKQVAAIFSETQSKAIIIMSDKELKKHGNERTNSK